MEKNFGITTITVGVSTVDTVLISDFIRRNNLRGLNGRLLSLNAVGENLFKDFVAEIRDLDSGVKKDE